MTTLNLATAGLSVSAGGKSISSFLLSLSMELLYSDISYNLDILKLQI